MPRPHCDACADEWTQAQEYGISMIENDWQHVITQHDWKWSNNTHNNHSGENKHLSIIHESYECYNYPSYIFHICALVTILVKHDGSILKSHPPLLHLSEVRARRHAFFLGCGIYIYIEIYIYTHLDWFIVFRIRSSPRSGPLGPIYAQIHW
jgi:hypothetical protein